METVIKTVKRPTGETYNETSNIIEKYVDSIIEMTGNSKFICPRFSANEYYADYVSLNTAISEAPATVGSIYWDDQDKTFTGVMEPSNGGSVKLQIGQEMYIRAVNKTGTTISNGEVVFVSGAQGNRPTIEPAIASNYTNSNKVIGVATEDIANNLYGYVTTRGIVRDLNTNDYTEGDCVFLSATTTGSFTTVTATDGNARLRVGMILKKHIVDGHLCVNIANDKYMFGDPDSGSVSIFESTGFQVDQGNAVSWNDFPPVPILGLKVPATGAPTLNPFTDGCKLFTFAVDDEAYGVQEALHEYKEGSDIEPHIHISTNGVDVDNRTVKFQLETTVANGNTAFPSASVYVGEATITANTTDRTHLIVPLETIDGTGLTIGAQGVYTIRRIASSGTEPTGDPFGITVGFHRQADTKGSRQEYEK